MADEHGFSEKELNAILDRLVKGKAPEEIMGQGGLVKDLTRRLVERALEGEMTAWVVVRTTGSSGEWGGPEPAPAPPGVESSGVGRLDVKDGRWLGRKNGRRGPGPGDRKGGLVRPVERRETMRCGGQVDAIESSSL